MNNNKKKISIILLVSLSLILIIVFLFVYNSRKDTYSCSRVPLADDKLRWGMDTAEIIAAVGEPSSIEHGDYGAVLTYDMALPCEFGDCTGASLYIGMDDKAYAGKTFSSGLMAVEITVDNASKEAILEKLSDIYGELSPNGGETQIEGQLKEANPDYFYQYHFCENWRAETLPEDTFNCLQQVQETAPDSWNVPIEKSTPLMYVNFWGTDGHPYTIKLDAAVFASYLHIEG